MLHIYLGEVTNYIIRESVGKYTTTASLTVNMMIDILILTPLVVIIPSIGGSIAIGRGCVVTSRLGHGDHELGNLNFTTSANCHNLLDDIRVLCGVNK